MQITDLVYIDATGYHFPDYPTMLQLFQDAYRGIYGADVNLDSDTQDGQWVAVQAKAAYDNAALGASVYNSFSPVTAQGVGLSRNVKINGLTRRVPTRSTADVTIVGQSGTVITNGIVIDTLSQKWDVPTTTIPGGGTITVTVVAQEDGALTADANTINQIFTPTRGWQTVNNVAAATPGAPVETDAELRVRQTQSVANPSLTVFDGTIGGVANLPGVTAVKGYENDDDSPDSNMIPGHSISVLVQGGDDTEIAEEIALHKTPGTNTYATGAGAVTETVYDAHGMPLEINFQRPTVATMTVRITVAANIGWSTDYETLIAAAVAETVEAFGIGSSILITKLYAPAYLIGTPAGQTFDISLIELKKDSGSYVTVNVDLNYDDIPVCDPTTDVVFIVT